MLHKVHLTQCKDSFVCKSGESVLESMCRLGKKGIPSGCRGGGCGICKVKVLSGEFLHKKMSSCHISQQDIDNNIVLACRIFAVSDLEVEVLGKMKKNVVREKELL